MLRTATVTVSRDGRDKGGVLVLEEMPAEPATAWIIRAGQLLMRSGVDVPAHIAEHGVTGFIAMGVGTLLSGFGKASWAETEPLLIELRGCVKTYRPPGGSVDISGWPAISSQIQEVTTHFQIYEEALSLMVGFSVAVALRTAYGRVAAILIDALGLSTATSAQNSDTSSKADSPA